MKIFLDTAKIEEIKAATETGIIDGVTTNPSLIYRSGRKDVRGALKEICQLVNPKPVSAEVISDSFEEMVKEACDLSKIAGNIVVKIPVTQEGIKAVKKLSSPGFGRKVKTNVTLVFTVSQALLAAKAGATYVSPFVGRIDDAKERGGRQDQGMDLVRDILVVFKNYGFSTEVIVASVRNLEHVKKSALLGAHIATLPFKVWQEIFEDFLTDDGIKKFLEDWEKVSKT